MVVKQQEHLYTADDLARMPEDGFQYELSKGRLIKWSRVKRLHAILTSHLIILLGAYIYAHDLGEISNEGG